MKSLLIIAAAVLLGVLPAGGFFIYKKFFYSTATTQSEGENKDIYDPGIPDPGNLYISMSEITGDFNYNTPTGRVFVVKGKVKNEYFTPRSNIKVAVKLYSKAVKSETEDGEKVKKLAKYLMVPCGNTLTEDQIKVYEQNEILDILSKKDGQNNSNMNVKPNEEIPFTAVFFHLPNDLDEFTVEVISSKKSGES